MVDLFLSNFTFFVFKDGCSSAFQLVLSSLEVFNIYTLRNGTSITDCSFKIRFQSPNSAFVDIDVYIIRRSNSPPRFELPSYSISIDEDTAVGSSIIQLNVTNRTPNEMKNIQFTLLATDDNKNVFSIDQNGLVTLAQSVDFEAISEYNIGVQGYDNAVGMSSEIVIVHIQIDNLNDNTPTLTDTQYTISVSESIDVGAEILRIAASDGDSGSFGEFFFKVIWRNDSGHFSVGMQGNISISANLDHETAILYKIVVQVEDNGGLKSPLVSVYINVLNDNEHRPVFTQSNYYWSLQETTQTGFYIGIIANDADRNATIEYSFKEQQSIFNIDNTTGKVSFQGTPFDYETEQEYAIQIIASDGEKSDQATLFVSIVNENDNMPSFTEKNQQFQV